MPAMTLDRHRVARWGALAVMAGVAALLVLGLWSGKAAPIGGLWSEAIAWIFTKQKEFHRALTAALGALSRDPDAGAAWWLIVASFLYGVFHAAGPGHGKAIVTTYLLTNRDKMRRGLALAAMSSFFQGLVAVVLVYGLIYLAGWLPRDANAAVNWSERISFALVTLMGGYLVLRAARQGWGRYRGAPAIDSSRASDQNHDHDHSQNHNQNHDHDHGGDGACCGHAHGPDAAQIERAGDLKTSIGIVLSVGLRPCTGAVLVLVLAKALGFAWAGVAAVMAMSLGTAATVAGIAFLAVHFRDWLRRHVGGEGRGWRTAGDLVGVAGGLLLAAMGGSLLVASFAPSHPLGL